MNGTDRLERELTAWFDDAATPRVPDYRADILASTATMRQRPRWSFPARWLPKAVVPRLPLIALRPLPWRTIVLLAVLGLLLAAAVALTVGSRLRTPAPFGLAVNGLVTYADEGDIWTVDPATGIRTPIVIGEEMDTYPRFSRDGTRIAFFRGVGDAVQLVITNADGTAQVASEGRPFVNADPDSIVWSPNGDYVAVAANGHASRTTYLVDTSMGSVRDLQTLGVDVEIYWRPLAAGQILYSATAGADRRRLFLLDVTDPEAEAVEVWPAEPNLRPGGWTPDGQRFVVHHWNGDSAWTDLVDPETGDTESLDVDYGRISNDGTRIVGFGNEGEVLCVIVLPRGTCEPIATGDDLPSWEHTTGLHWSPDDRWIAVYPMDGSGWLLLDPDGGPPVKPDWAGLGIESWQRTATWSWW